MALTIGAYEEQQQGEYAIIAEGEYECTVRDFKPTQSGSGFMISYRIRNDFSQPHQKQVIFGDFISDSEKMTWKVNALAKYTGIPEGTPFATIEQFLNTIIGKPVRVVVKHEEYNFNTQARVKSIKQPQAREVAPTMPNTAPDFSTTIDINEDDLPF